MTAKEYLIHTLGYPEWMVNESSFYQGLCDMMDGYHQAKSEEEVCAKTALTITEEEIEDIIRDNADDWDADEDGLEYCKAVMIRATAKAILSKLKGE